MTAPIIIFCYNRPDHLRRTLEALAANDGAQDSDLTIYSDGPREASTSSSVDALRVYLHSEAPLGSFRKVSIVESPSNKGLAASVIEGVTRVISERKSAIVLEDDIVTAPSFLGYMNETLARFNDDHRIWSISGYSFPVSLPRGYDQEIYLSWRASSWGWATWKDRWDLVDWDVKDYPSFRVNPIARIKFNRGGRDMAKMLDRQMESKIDSWAIRWCYGQSKRDMYTVYPIRSLVENIGLDGSGTHSRISDRDSFQGQRDAESIPVMSNPVPCRSILQSHRDHFGRALAARALRKAVRMAESVMLRTKARKPFPGGPLV